MADPPLTRATIDVLALFLQSWDEESDLHGWLIMKSVGRSGPTVYSVLDRLEDAGWISGFWETLPVDAPHRPRRRYYRLTAAGAAAAREQVPLPAPRPLGRLRTQPGFGYVQRQPIR
jgi:DNA-binding PadR family transcriptional regulator